MTKQMWQAVLPTLIAGINHGDEAAAAAANELIKMAKEADAYEVAANALIKIQMAEERGSILSPMINTAISIAAAAHSGATRKFTGLPYITHPASVAAMVAEFVPGAHCSTIAAAWLHDVIEDTPMTADQLEVSIGTRATSLVMELTKPASAVSLDAMQIKACDLIDNLSTIHLVAPKKIATDYLAKKWPQVRNICVAITEANEPLAKRLITTWAVATSSL